MTNPATVRAVDAALDGVGLVVGRLPPQGRDLDVLVEPADGAVLEAALRAAGFRPYGSSWLRLGPDGAEAVDVLRPGWGGLSPAVREAVRAAAEPLPGYTRLRRPAAHHALLLLAHRVARDGRLGARHRERLEALLADDPCAWTRARDEAPAWPLPAALDLLGTALASPSGVVPRVARWRATGPRVPAGRRGGVVAVSGLDGSGKSTQAALVAAGLEALGRPSAVHWTRLAVDPRLDRLARPVQRLLLPRGRGRPARPNAPAVDPSRVARPAQSLRQRSRLATSAWALVVATLNADRQRRGTRTLLRGGRVVVCDRWTLDSAVHLRYRYGEDRRFRLAVSLVRLLSPRPLLQVHLEVPPALAYARKDDHYLPEQLARQARLYVEEAGRAGALRLDGTRPAVDLAHEILSAVDGLVRRGGVARQAARAVRRRLLAT